MTMGNFLWEMVYLKDSFTELCRGEGQEPNCGSSDFILATLEVLLFILFTCNYERVKLILLMAKNVK